MTSSNRFRIPRPGALYEQRTVQDSPTGALYEQPTVQDARPGLHTCDERLDLI